MPAWGRWSGHASRRRRRFDARPSGTRPPALGSAPDGSATGGPHDGGGGSAPGGPDILAGKPLAGPNQWAGLPGWKADVQAYYDAIVGLGNHVLRGLALALELPESYFTTLSARHIGRCRLLHYPPQPGVLTG